MEDGTVQVVQSVTSVPKPIGEEAEDAQKDDELIVTLEESDGGMRTGVIVGAVVLAALAVCMYMLLAKKRNALKDNAD